MQSFDIAVDIQQERRSRNLRQYFRVLFSAPRDQVVCIVVQPRHGLRRSRVVGRGKRLAFFSDSPAMTETRLRRCDDLGGAARIERCKQFADAHVGMCEDQPGPVSLLHDKSNTASAHRAARY